jgi:hypothetical protein
MSLFDRYTVDDPPKRGSCVWWVDADDIVLWSGGGYRDLQLKSGFVHRTQESAERHRHALVCGDRLVVALEDLLTQVEQYGHKAECDAAHALLAEIRGEDPKELAP